MAYLRSGPNIFRNTFKHLSSLRSFSELVVQQSSISPATKEPSGLGDAMVNFVCGDQDSAKPLHRRVWGRFVNKGDAVIDATCGEGHDTLALLKMVADSTGRGRVYALDVQPRVLEKASEFLDQNVTPEEKELVQLYAMCHSNLDYVVPASVPVRLVAFEFGSCHKDKIKKKSDTTLLALTAAQRILAPGGLISIMLPIDRPGERGLFEMVQEFTTQLPAEEWSCCKFERFSRPSARVLFLLVKR